MIKWTVGRRWRTRRRTRRRRRCRVGRPEVRLDAQRPRVVGAANVAVRAAKGVAAAVLYLHAVGNSYVMAAAHGRPVVRTIVSGTAPEVRRQRHLLCQEVDARVPIVPNVIIPRNPALRNRRCNGDVVAQPVHGERRAAVVTAVVPRVRAPAVNSSAKAALREEPL